MTDLSDASHDAACGAAPFNDAYVDTWTGRRLLVMRRLGELPPDVARLQAEGAELPMPEAEFRPVHSCTTDESLELSPDQRERLERLKDAVLADHGQAPRATGRWPLAPERLRELAAIVSGEAASA